MSITNKEKTPPKNDIKFSVTLSEEQKVKKTITTGMAANPDKCP